MTFEPNLLQVQEGGNHRKKFIEIIPSLYIEVLTVRLYDLKLKDFLELPKCKYPKNGTLILTLIKKQDMNTCFLTRSSFFK